MPVTKTSMGLVGIGMACAAACRVAWANKTKWAYADPVYRIGYVCMWPTAGTGVMLMVQPENENVVEKLYKSGHIDKEKYEELRAKHESGAGDSSSS